MNLYFIADIFRNKPAGIYRYSAEMARRFLADKNVNLIFVVTDTTPIDLVEPRLLEIFDTPIKIYDTRDLLGLRFNGRWLNRCLCLHERFKSLVRKEGRSGLKPLREFFKLLSIIAHYFSRMLPFRYDGENCVLFSPYPHAGNLLHANKRPFFVHVVHDVIPIIHPEYFDTTHVFRKIFDALCNADLIITVSEHTKENLLEHHPRLSPGQVYAIPIAASDHFLPESNLDRLQAIKSKYGIPQDSDYVLSLSTIEPRKNHVRLLKAWGMAYSNLRLKSPKLVLAGDKGWGLRYQQEMGGALEAMDSIIITGFIDDEDLPTLYSGCVFSVYPSLYEGFGLPVLESMKCGRFCLTSNVSSMPEVAGRDGMLVDPYSIKDIASCIMRLSNDPQYRKDLEQQAFEQSASFSWDRTYDRTVNLIPEGIAPNNRRPSH